MPLIRNLTPSETSRFCRFERDIHTYIHVWRLARLPEVPPLTNFKKLNWWSNTERFSWGIWHPPKQADFVGLRETYIHAQEPQTYIHTHYSPVALIKTSTNACQTVSKSPSVHLRKFLEPRTVQYVKKERPISSTIIQHLCRRDQQFKTRLVWCYPTIAQGLAKSACGHNAGRYLM